MKKFWISLTGTAFFWSVGLACFDACMSPLLQNSTFWGQIWHVIKLTGGLFGLYLCIVGMFVAPAIPFLLSEGVPWSWIKKTFWGK